jgi:ABC-type nitrate/sulfonate/bicarbonate transport system ATPase subunit
MMRERRATKDLSTEGDVTTARTSSGAAVSEEVFRCENVSVEFPTAAGPRVVLSDVTFSVAEREFVSIVGHSGTGKSTLLRVLGGLESAGAGSRVAFRGVDVTGPPKGVVMLFQDYRGSLLPWRTVEKNVALGIEATLSRAEREERVAEALALVGLGDRAKDYPWRLSGGMQQRVQIARALAMRPQVLLMDEPFGALDAMTKGQLQDELQRLHAVTGSTIVFVTHDIEEAVYLSDRVMVLAGEPARVTRAIATDLPRPREQVATKEMPQYLEVRHEVYNGLRHVGDHG